MSRSHKNVPCLHVVKRHRGMKRTFNKRMRRMGIVKITSSFSSYKKANEIWGEDDYRIVGETFAEYRRCCLRREPDAGEAVIRRDYYRYYSAK